MENSIRLAEFATVVNHPLSLAEVIALNTAMTSDDNKYDNNLTLRLGSKFATLNRVGNNIVSIVVYEGTLNFQVLSQDGSSADSAAVNFFGKTDIYVSDGVFVTSVIDHLFHGEFRSYCLEQDKIMLVEVTQFAFGKKEGLQILYSENGGEEHITWMQDAKHGAYKGITSTHLVTGEYRNNVKSGVWKLFEGEQIRTVKRYSAHLDSLFGYKCTYSKEGVLETSGFMLKDLKHGKFLEPKSSGATPSTSYYIFNSEVTEEVFNAYDFSAIDAVLNVSGYWSENEDPYLTVY